MSASPAEAAGADPETIREIRTAARELAARFPDPYWAKMDAEAEFPWEFYEAFASAGWLGVAIPARYGGAGLGIRAAVALLYEIAASGAGMNGCSPFHLTIFGLNIIARHGDEALREELLPAADEYVHDERGMLHARHSSTCGPPRRRERKAARPHEQGSAVPRSHGGQGGLLLVPVRQHQRRNQRRCQLLYLPRRVRLPAARDLDRSGQRRTHWRLLRQSGHRVRPEHAVRVRMVQRGPAQLWQLAFAGSRRQIRTSFAPRERRR